MAGEGRIDASKRDASNEADGMAVKTLQPGRLHRAQLATIHGPIANWFRQTPAGDGIFGATQFSEAGSGDADEWLVTCDALPDGFATRIPRQRRILFLGEPPEIKTYQPDFLNQFGTVVGPLALPAYRGRHLRQHSALPWHYGKARPMRWADYAADKPKDLLLSVFCSDKAHTPQQRLRMAFVDRLKQEFGSALQHFGNGFHPLDEKADGLDRFRYTLVLENNLRDGFWTEKLADAYLGHCLPIYAGGRIPQADFDPAARIEIDLGAPDAAVAAIAALLREDPFGRLEPLLRAQRRRLMLEHNFFAVADRIIAAGEGAPARRHWRPQRMLANGERLRGWRAFFVRNGHY